MAGDQTQTRALLMNLMADHISLELCKKKDRDSIHETNKEGSAIDSTVDKNIKDAKTCAL